MQQIDISNKSLIELKAIHFDILREFERARANLQTIVRLIEEKEQAPIVETKTNE